MNEKLSVIVCGARRRQQGIGEYITRWLAYQGAEICAIVGTSDKTVEQARLNLRQNYKIKCRGYTSLEQAIEQEKPHAVAICTPYQTHFEQLRLVAEKGLHCLCEKPLWWSEESDFISKTERLLNIFSQQNAYLQLVTQWPHTLDFYYRLYPDLNGRKIEKFSMKSSPVSKGTDMIIDAVPHVLSMLHFLVGSGKIQNIKAQYLRKDKSQLNLAFLFVHLQGTVNVSVQLQTTPESPRPAGYAINDNWVERTVSLPKYEIYLSNQHQKILIEDPLKLLIGDFITNVVSGKKPEREILINSITELQNLFRAVN